MVPVETQQILDETSGKIYPLQFVQVSSLHNVPTPLVRVSTCGGLQLEVLQEVTSTDPAQGRYQVVSLHNRPKGSSTGLTLLKVLASLPEHYASKDWLTEHLPRTRMSTEEEDEEGWGQGLIRVDNVVYLLRGLLCPPRIAGEETIRKVLVAYVRNHRESGPGYRLAADPLVWLDVDMIAASVKHALLEQEGKEALSCWEQVYALASKGIYLPDEAYSDWAKDTRLRVEGYLRQAVHALHRLYLSRESEAGEEKAIVLLRSYWQTHPLDEDMLRSLLELLGKHNGLQEALDCYQHLCKRLEQEGRTPDPRTQKTIHNLRIGQSAYNHLIEVRQPPKDNSISPSSTQDKAYDPFSSFISPSIIGAYEPDAYKRALELATSQKQDLESDTVVDRREAAKHLGTLGLTLVTMPYRLFEGFPSASSKHSSLDRETLALFSGLTDTCLRLSEGSQLKTAERVLWSYLPEVEAFAQSPSENQCFAANIVAQSYLIAASLVGHHNNLQARKHFSEQAWHYGMLAQDWNLQVAALRQLAVTFDYLERPQNVLQTYHKALPYINDVSPRLRACIFAALSGVYAQLQQKQEATRFIGLAYEHFPEKIEDEPNFLRLINANYHTIILWDGLNHIELNQPQRAEKIFAGLDVLAPLPQIPERIRIELLNYRAKAFTLVNNMEQACTYLEVAVEASIELHSERRLRESFTVFQQIRLQWPQERRVQQLGDLFFHALINHKE